MKIKLSKIITGILLAGTLLSTQVSALTTSHFGDGLSYMNSRDWSKSDGSMEVCLIAHGEDKTLIFIMELWNWQ